LAASAPQFQSGWRIPLKAPIELSNINVFKRFRNYCGLIKVARSGFPWEKTTKGDMAPPDFLRAALTEGNDVRLSSRKAACSSRAPPSSTGNPGSVYTNCETAVALRLITAKRPLKTMRNKRTMRTKLLLVTTTSHGSWSDSSVPDYHTEQVALQARHPDRTGFPAMP
jgi:hypothetical protein